MIYQDLISNLNKITKVEKEEDLEVIFINSINLVKSLAKLKYRRIDYADAEDIANEVGIRIIEKFNEDKNFQVTNWFSYLTNMMRDVFKQKYKYYSTVQSLSYLNPENTEDEFCLIQEELDSNKMVDFKSSVENSYLVLQDLIKDLPFKSEEVKFILERLITFAVSVDESILDALPPTFKRIAKANYAILRSELCKYKEYGLLTSKAV